jgi:hypothetical protein
MVSVTDDTFTVPLDDDADGDDEPEDVEPDEPEDEHAAAARTAAVPATANRTWPRLGPEARRDEVIIVGFPYSLRTRLWSLRPAR